jgi:hypothetical protein
MGKITIFLYVLFLVNFRNLIKILYFIFNLLLDLVEPSYGWLPIFLHLPMDDGHLGYIQKFLKITPLNIHKGSNRHSCSWQLVVGIEFACNQWDN